MTVRRFNARPLADYSTAVPYSFDPSGDLKFYLVDTFIELPGVGLNIGDQAYVISNNTFWIAISTTTWSLIGPSTGSALTVQEEDGTPIDTAVTIIRFPNGSVTDNGVGDVSVGFESATAHIADTDDAHDASAISILDTAADFTATNVEDALAELQSDNEAHTAAADPHTGYRLESADHTHQTSGLQAGTLDHGLALTGLTDDDHTQYTLRSILTTDGDLYTRTAGVIARLGVGSNTNILSVVGGLPAWVTAATVAGTMSHSALLGLTSGDDHTQYTRKDTLTTTGDLYYASAASTPARLGIGSATNILSVVGGLPAWTSVATIAGTLSHSLLLNLSNDDHTQYALLIGRAGGQTLQGGTAASNNLTLESTSNATKGSIVALDKVIFDNTGLTTDNLFYASAISTTEPGITFDTTDYLSYDRTTNKFQFIIGSTVEMTITADGVSIPDGYLVVSKYARFGSVSAPANITDGDVNAIRLYIGADAAILSGLSAQVAGVLGISADNQLRFYDSDNSNYIAFRADSARTTNIVYVLPATDPTAGQFLSAGVPAAGVSTLSWAAGSSSPLTTKGDIWGYSTVDARIPVGTDDYVLTADSSAALGVSWQAPVTSSMTLTFNTSGVSLAGITTIDIQDYDAFPPVLTRVSSSIARINLSLYALLGGREGGQILYGGSDGDGTLILSSTLDSAKGFLTFGESDDETLNTNWNERDNLWGFGTGDPQYTLDIWGTVAINGIPMGPYSVVEYVFVPDASAGSTITAGNQQGMVLHSGPNSEIAVRLYVDAETAPGASGLPITLQYGDTDDLDTVVTWTTIATLTLSSQKSVFTTVMATYLIPGNRLLRMNIGTIVGSPADASITLRAHRRTVMS